MQLVSVMSNADLTKNLINDRANGCVSSIQARTARRNVHRTRFENTQLAALTPNSLFAKRTERCFAYHSRLAAFAENRRFLLPSGIVPLR